MMDEMTEYERKRLENVKRNQEMLAALRVHDTVQDLHSASNHKQSKSEHKGFKAFKQEKRAREEPTVIRRSLRTRGLSPDAVHTEGLSKDSPSSSTSASPSSYKKGFLVTAPNSLNPEAIREKGPLSLAETYIQHKDDGSDTAFLNRLKTLIDNVPLADFRVAKPGRVKEPGTDSASHKAGVGAAFSLEDLELSPKDVARVAPERIFCAHFLPCRERVIVVAGDKAGHLSLWDVDCDENEGDGVSIYRPHSAPVTGIVTAPFCIAKVLSCSYDGFIRCMDIEKEVFDMLYSTDDGLSAICCVPFSHQSIYFAQGYGEMKMMDERVGGIPNSYNLHEKRINSIDFNPQRAHLMSTSSTDGTACIWDLRNMGKSHVKSLATVQHQRAVHAAYFSPSGNYLATTSYDDRVGLTSGLAVGKTSMIYHNNQSNRWISTFRGIWGWDDQYLFIANTGRALDAISTSSKTTTTLRSPFIRAIPSRLAKHPFHCGTLAGATAGGQVYVWRKASF
eukprot:Gb_04703 [translate_table: standard]